MIYLRSDLIGLRSDFTGLRSDLIDYNYEKLPQILESLSLFIKVVVTPKLGVVFQHYKNNNNLMSQHDISKVTMYDYCESEPFYLDSILPVTLLKPDSCELITGNVFLAVK